MKWRHEAFGHYRLGEEAAVLYAGHRWVAVFGVVDTEGLWPGLCWYFDTDSKFKSKQDAMNHAEKLALDHKEASQWPT